MKKALVLLTFCAIIATVVPSCRKNKKSCSKKVVTVEHNDIDTNIDFDAITEESEIINKVIKF